jgi:hypothetical protein
MKALRAFGNKVREDGRGIFGPAAIPDAAYHYVSRQTCRAYLRACWLVQVSRDNPNMSRRERRKSASLFARLQYRRDHGVNA